MEVLDMSEEDAKRWFNDKTATELSIAQLVRDIKEYVDPVSYTHLPKCRICGYDRSGTRTSLRSSVGSQSNGGRSTQWLSALQALYVVCRWQKMSGCQEKGEKTMSYQVKITVIKRNHDPELVEHFLNNPETGKCSIFQEGQESYVTRDNYDLSLIHISLRLLDNAVIAEKPYISDYI